MDHIAALKKYRDILEESLLALAILSGDKPRFEAIGLSSNATARLLPGSGSAGTGVPLIVAIRAIHGHEIPVAIQQMGIPVTLDLCPLFGELCHSTTAGAITGILEHGIQPSAALGSEMSRLHVHLLPYGPQDSQGRIPLSLPRNWSETRVVICLDKVQLVSSHTTRLWANTAGTVLSDSAVKPRFVTRILENGPYGWSIVYLNNLCRKYLVRDSGVHFIQLDMSAPDSSVPDIVGFAICPAQHLSRMGLVRCLACHHRFRYEDRPTAMAMSEREVQIARNFAAKGRGRALPGDPQSSPVDPKSQGGGGSAAVPKGPFALHIHQKGKFAGKGEQSAKGSAKEGEAPFHTFYNPAASRQLRTRGLAATSHVPAPDDPHTQDGGGSAAASSGVTPVTHGASSSSGPAASDGGGSAAASPAAVPSSTDPNIRLTMKGRTAAPETQPGVPSKPGALTASAKKRALRSQQSNENIRAAKVTRHLNRWDVDADYRNRIASMGGTRADPTMLTAQPWIPSDDNLFPPPVDLEILAIFRRVVTNYMSYCNSIGQATRPSNWMLAYWDRVSTRYLFDPLSHFARDAGGDWAAFRNTYPDAFFGNMDGYDFNA